ncbi:MAG: DUF3604 domain-containing protein, partial [Proteobacteria bacterium]|nr:DUF3604 domain-containing protein [Pseudomonadota bacterium]
MKWRRAYFGLGLALLLVGCKQDLDLDAFGIPEGSQDPGREACAERSPLRRALFGDLHVHTTLSSDAWSYDVAARPSDAYAYAFGDPIRLPPNDPQGRGTREVRIDRPLHFAAVTDHAEFLGERLLCADPESGVYDTRTCEAIRISTAPMESPLSFKIMNPFSGREEEVCGPDGERCARETDGAWREIVAAAEQWYDRSPECSRTTLIGYEYSSFRLGSNHHRNVIFRGSVVPGRPISFLEAKREWHLWEWLRETCIDTGTGCDALAIPHNSNIGNGRMFAIDYPGAWGASAQAARAELRSAVEPVVEVMQHKGDSECRRGLSTILGSDDEWCDFEKFEFLTLRRHGDEQPGECWDGPFADWIPHLGPDCLSHRSYARYALIEGLAEEARIGANPFKFGLIASTDTHNAMAGGVAERDWPGHLGIRDARAESRLSTQAGAMASTSSNPGGLAGVWAEENTREAIFDALRRREVFGTSGPRIEPRLFGGWDYPADLCDDPELTARADAGGVPMGADLPPRTGDASPAFA